MALTDEEFQRKFLARATHLAKLKLAIEEDRYTIWIRKGAPNFPDEYLKAILDLPDSHPVAVKKPRESGGPGYDYVVEVKYNYVAMGRSVPVYMKAFYSKDGEDGLVIGIEVQSLRENQPF